MLIFTITRESQDMELGASAKLAEYMGVSVEELYEILTGERMMNEQKKDKEYLDKSHKFYNLYLNADEKTKKAIDLLLKG